MQLNKITLLALFGLTAASPIKSRTAASVESAISTVSSELKVFDGDVTSFTGSLFQALALYSAYNTLAGDITSATSAVTSTGALSSSDSATIYAQVNSLTTQITSTLSDAEAKACSFSLTDPSAVISSAEFS
jgi:hypothetical protein